MITATITQLEELDARLQKVARENDMDCDHAVGICCGWHYEGYRGTQGSPAPINKRRLYEYAKELKQTMLETDKVVRAEGHGAWDCYPPEAHEEVRAIIKAVRLLGAGRKKK